MPMKVSTYGELLDTTRYLYMKEEGVDTPSYKRFADGYEDATYGLVAVCSEIVAEFIERYDATVSLCDVVIIRMSDGNIFRPIAAWDESEFGIRGGELAADWVEHNFYGH